MRDFASCYNEQAVKVFDSSCSGSGSGGSSSSRSNSSARDPSVQSTVTCLYRTKLSTQKEFSIRVTWSECLIGQGFSIGVDEPPSHHNPRKPNSGNSLLLRKKKGSRSYDGVSGDSVIGLYWDISSAKYGSGPEPVQDFYVVVVVDGEFGLLLGDMSREHIKKFEEYHTIPIAEFSMVGRREQVLGNTLYSTKARFRDGGGDHEILIRCKGDGRDAKDSELSVCIDKKKVVHVRRLKWNFRGNQTIFVDGLPVDVMWDVHNWWFGDDTSSSGGCAAFMFRTRSALQSRLWLLEEESSSSSSSSSKEEQSNKSGFFSLLIHAFKIQ